MPIFGRTQPPTACQGCCGLNLLTAESQRTEAERAGEEEGSLCSLLSSVSDAELAQGPPARVGQESTCSDSGSQAGLGVQGQRDPCDILASEEPLRLDWRNLPAQPSLLSLPRRLLGQTQLLYSHFTGEETKADAGKG